MRSIRNKTRNMAQNVRPSSTNMFTCLSNCGYVDSARNGSCVAVKTAWMSTSYVEDDVADCRGDMYAKCMEGGSESTCVSSGMW